ncbi:MAG: PD-(D/E)XK nuclease family protein [Candidatus Aenigmarchaeota archaeon]|nr:PD-(D/E)XK nuclease family protein [Candidatus Aenigmarchaeota archaeon]
METDPDRLKIFEVGNLLHDFVMHVFKNEKNADKIKFLESEIPIKKDFKDFMVSGRLDDVVIAVEDGRKMIIEVKSVADIRRADTANKNHVMQLQFYMHATGIKDGIILYIDKKNLKTRAFEIPYDEMHSMDIIKRFRVLHELLVKDVLPIDEAKRNDDMNWMCNMCEYRSKCDRNEK